MKLTFENLFKETVSKYTKDKDLMDFYWDDIQCNYTSPERHYHNLSHIQYMSDLLYPKRAEIKNWDTIIFAIAYHDYYMKFDGSKQNEEVSAVRAGQRLEEIGYPHIESAFCVALILSTQNHEKGMNRDADLFLDADMAILTAGPDEYKRYTENIRKEYSSIPTAIFNKARSEWILSTMNTQIFHTDLIPDGDIQAKINLTNELYRLNI